LSGTDYAADTWAFTIDNPDDDVFAAGVAIVITIPIKNPPLVQEIEDDWEFYIKTETATDGTDYPTDLNDVEESIQPPTTGLTTTTIKSTTGISGSITGSLDGIGVSGATYQFSFKTTNPIPVEGIMVLTVPSGVTVVDNDVSDYTVTCSSGCTNAASASISYSAAYRQVTISDAFSSYTASSTTVTISVTGWTNPDDSESYDFTIDTFAYISDTKYGIETFTDMSIAASEGICYVQDIYVTDGDTRVYASPESYTIQAWCNHAIETTYGLKVVFPDDYIVKD